MASPKPWLIIQALAAQFAGILQANGYLTDAGGAIWTEPAQRKEDVALGVSIVTIGIDKWQGERPNKRGRTLKLVVEAAISVLLDNAHELAHQLVEDIESSVAALTAAGITPNVPQVTPFEIETIDIADRPEGVTFIIVQIHLSVGYLR